MDTDVQQKMSFLLIISFEVTQGHYFQWMNTIYSRKTFWAADCRPIIDLCIEFAAQRDCTTCADVNN